MSRHQRENAAMAATAGAVTPALVAFIGHPATLTVLVALAVDTIVTVSYWLWLLRRDRQRQRTAEALVHAFNGRPGRIILDSGGGIEIHQYYLTGSGQNSSHQDTPSGTSSRMAESALPEGALAL